MDNEIRCKGCGTSIVKGDPVCDNIRKLGYHEGCFYAGFNAFQRLLIFNKVKREEKCRNSEPT